MPPQQGKSLLDFVDNFLNLGTHWLPDKFFGDGQVRLG